MTASPQSGSPADSPAGSPGGARFSAGFAAGRSAGAGPSAPFAAGRSGGARFSTAFAAGRGRPEPVRFAALGDSVTVGLGDPLPQGGWRGWAALLAEAMAPAESREISNFARCGALVEDVATDQLPRALAQRPSHASVLVGINDTLRGDFEIAPIAARLEATVAALRRAGVVVLTASLPEPGRMLRVPELVCRPLARRVQAINAVIDHLAIVHETIHLDLARNPAVYDPEMWGVDRIHPSERGHRLLADLFATGLAERGVPLWSLPDPYPSNPPPSLWAQVHWLATKGTGWMFRRSLDLLPGLTRLVIAEAWHEIRDQTARLDDRLRSELAQVLPSDAYALNPGDLRGEPVGR